MTGRILTHTVSTIRTYTPHSPRSSSSSSTFDSIALILLQDTELVEFPLLLTVALKLLALALGVTTGKDTYSVPVFFTYAEAQVSKSTRIELKS